MSPRKVYWIGTEYPDCQVCHRPFLGVMYDAGLPGAGWGCICKNCFLEYGCRLGTGHGQKYELQKDKRWLKTGG